MYLTHKELSQYWVIDIETDSLTPTVIWCIVVKNIGTKEIWRFVNDASYLGTNVGVGHCSSFRGWVSSLSNPVFVGHNALSFDVPVINRLLGTSIQESSVVDTLVLSYLYYPRQPGGHSLESWGERFRFPKGDFHDFSRFSPEMLSYCERDVELTEALFLRLTSRMLSRGFSERSCALEHQIRSVIDQQQRNGFYFDVSRAEALLSELRGRQQQLGLDIEVLFPPELTELGEYEYRLKGDGTPFASYTRHCEDYPRITRDGGSYTVWDYQPFNIGSPTQRVQKLLQLGWEPDSWTPKGNPQADEESLVRASERLSRPEVQAMADWLVLQGRASMVEGWLTAVNREDFCIHGSVASCGAATRRMTHWAPNTANIPKAKPKVKYGRECRELWRARPGRVLVGYDASALEMRMFCHYLNNPELTKVYLEGDPHQRNADAFGVERDPTAKTIFYAFLYGAQDRKLGSIIGAGADAGTKLRTALFSANPGLQGLIDEVQDEYYSCDGWITCIDGGLVRCGSPHAALNYKLQSAGGIVMKQASILLDRMIKEQGLDALKVGDIHDEGQIDCPKRDAERVAELAVQAIRDAGLFLNFNLPLDGGYKIGETWADTH